MLLIRIRIRILLSICKNSKKNLDSYYFVTLFDFLSLKNDVNVPSKSNSQKKLCKNISFLLASWRSMTKIAGFGSESGSINQRHGSADPDPDPPPKCHGSATLQIRKPMRNKWTTALSLSKRWYRSHLFPILLVRIYSLRLYQMIEKKLAYITIDLHVKGQWPYSD